MFENLWAFWNKDNFDYDLDSHRIPR